MRFNLKEKQPRSPFWQGFTTGVKIAIVPALASLLGVAGTLIISTYSRDNSPPPANTSAPTEQQ